MISMQSRTASCRTDDSLPGYLSHCIGDSMCLAPHAQGPSGCMQSRLITILTCQAIVRYAEAWHIVQQYLSSQFFSLLYFQRVYIVLPPIHRMWAAKLLLILFAA